jgi:hypothetical protein
MAIYLDNSRIFNFFVLCGVLIFILSILVGYNFYKIYTTSNVLEDSMNTQLLYLAQNQNNIAKLNEYVKEEDDWIYDDLEPKIEANKRLINSKMNNIVDVKSKVDSNKKLIEANIDNIKGNKDEITSQQDILNKYKLDQADIIKNITNNQQTIQSNIASFTYNDFKNIRDRLQDSESNIGNIRAHIVDINAEKIPSLEARLNNFGSNISRIDTELEDLDAQFSPINVQLASFSNDVLNKLNSESILSRLNDVDYRSRQNKTKTSNNFDKFANYMTTKDMNKYYVKSKDHTEWLETKYAPLHDKVEGIEQTYMTTKDMDKYYVKTKDHNEWIETKYAPLHDKVEGIEQTYMTNKDIKRDYMTNKDIKRDYMTKEDLMKTFVEQEDENIV